MSFLREKSTRTTMPIGRGRFTTAEIDMSNGQTVIKEVNALLIGGNNYRRDYTQKQFIEEVINPAIELTNPKYGIAQFIPNFHFEWGLDSHGFLRGSFVMERVLGTDIENINHFSVDQAIELDTLIANSLIAANTTRRNGSYLRPDIFRADQDGDLSLTNIVLGKTHPDQPIRPYLIDLYPARWGILPEFTGLKDPLKDLIDSLPNQSNGYQYPKSRNALLQR